MTTYPSDLPSPEEEAGTDGVENEELSIKEPFNPEQIKIHTQNVVAAQVVTRIDEKEIDLAPDFQRAYVWKNERQSRLIESLLLRIPIPVFYVAADDEDSWKVVDGVQRITTIYRYIKNEFALQNLEYLKDLEGLSYDDLPRPMQRRISETQLVVNVIDTGTPEEVMFNVFSRINTGGEPLSAQEIRHALTPGEARSYLKKLAESRAFTTATGGAVNSLRMKDRECVLRFLAFYMEPWDRYGVRDNLNDYLSKAMRKINQITAEERARLAADFEKAMNAASRIFERDAFRRRYANRRGPVNMTLLETWGAALAGCTSEEIEVLVAKRESLKDKWSQLINDDSDFIESISYSTDTRSRIEKRFTAIENLVRSIV